MDKKKIIGAIIGVTLFAVLIAGATYAWLSAAVDVNNGIYQASTGNFLIDYNGGIESFDVCEKGIYFIGLRGQKLREIYLLKDKE